VDDKTLMALTDLAAKLGTTAEYLWAAMLRQAPISGAIDLALMAALVVASVVWSRVVLRKTKTPQGAPAAGEYRNYAEWNDEVAVGAWASAIVLVVVTAVVVITNLPASVSAFLNPEYWALSQLLKLK
jgi:hypothetical protein